MRFRTFIEEIDLYHGTHSDFTEPSWDKMLTHDQDYGPGFYTTPSHKTASGFVFPDDPTAHVGKWSSKVNNPFYADTPLSPQQADELMGKLLKQIVPREMSFLHDETLEKGFGAPSEDGWEGLTGNDVVKRIERLFGSERLIQSLKDAGYDAIYGGYGLGKRSKEPEQWKKLDLHNLGNHPANDFQQIVLIDPKQTRRSEKLPPI